HCRPRHLLQVHDDARIALTEAVEQGRHQDIRCCGRRADPQLSRSCICEKFNVPQALLELVEGSATAREQCVSVQGRLDAAPAAIKQLHSDVVLELRDDLRHCGLRHPKLRGCLGQAAGLHDHREHAEVSEPQALSNMTIPVDDFCNKQLLGSSQEIQGFCLYQLEI